MESEFPNPVRNEEGDDAATNQRREPMPPEQGKPLVDLSGEGGAHASTAKSAHLHRPMAWVRG